MRIISAVCGVAIALFAATAAGQASSTDANLQMQQELARILGEAWTVRTTNDGVEATRSPRRPPIAGFDVRVDEQIRAARAREHAMTVALAGSAAHLAGIARDCDDVVETARALAAIGGVNGLVIDTQCSPRQ